MNMYEKILRWYQYNLWNEKQVKDAYEKSVISKEQYQQILESK